MLFKYSTLYLYHTTTKQIRIMKNLTITNLENVTTLNVNMSEIENSILNGENSFSNLDHTFFFIFLPINRTNQYKLSKDEVFLNTEEGVTILIKKI